MRMWRASPAIRGRAHSPRHRGWGKPQGNFGFRGLPRWVLRADAHFSVKPEKYHLFLFLLFKFFGALGCWGHCLKLNGDFPLGFGVCFGLGVLLLVVVKTQFRIW